jgi:[ribosomal protein S18]-alanine N-acetyltransferase
MIIHCPESIQIVPLSARHLNCYLTRMLEIEQEAYPDPWPQRMFRHEFTSDISHFFLAFHENELIGYAGFWLILEEAHITRVTIAEGWRGLGFGRALVLRLLERAEKAGAEYARLEVREHNERAQRLYDSLGFRREGRWKEYYAGTGESAIVMLRQLGGRADAGDATG